MATVHFVYNKGQRLKTPERITYEIAERLGRRYSLAIYDQRETGTIHPRVGDILIGHPSRYTQDALFNRSFRQDGWARRIVFCPFSYGMPRDAAAIDPLVEDADLHLALCGPYWFDTMDTSIVSHWRYKTMRCDLGVNRTHYPQVKQAFNPPGRRRFVYIGNAGPMKGVDFLCRLAEANPGLDFGWIGWTGEDQRPAGTLRREYDPLERRLRSGRFRVHGGADWRERRFVDVVCDYDILLTCGRSDSNPTTILETSAWGLVPVAPAQCGYYGDDWLVNIPLDDVDGASQILHRLNQCPDAELLARREAGYRQLDAHYTWDHAAQQVIDCIEAPLPVAPTDAAWLDRKRRNQAALRTLARAYDRQQRIEDALLRVANFSRRVMRRASRLVAGGA